ncbi:hypothetical protein P152DRAFT_379029, partial [Eremomyces bilateralis CBS 781.70]
AFPHANSHQSFYRPPSQLSIHRKPSTASLNSNFFDDLDDSLPESTMLSPSGTPASLMSPQMSTVWDDFTTSGPFSHSQERSDSVSTNPFGQTNNPFLRLEPAQAAMYGQQSVWTPFDRSDSSSTPTPVQKYEPFGSEFDSGAQHHRPHVFPVHPPSNDFGAVPMQQQPSQQPLPNVRPSSIFPSATPLAQSPTTEKQWMALPPSSSVQPGPVEERPAPKRMRPNSPQRTLSYATFPRPDGIRKKNARLDIPVERNLTNIDRLIHESSNDEEKKELKAQKRLLRNRQAALDSRQRKKKHTEELELEKKSWDDRLQVLEAEVNALRIQSGDLHAEKDQWMRERCVMVQQIETAQWEKEELVRSHTLETGDLRKKVNFLREQLDATAAGGIGAGMGDAPQPMATGHHVGAFNEFTNEMDNLTMASEWDNYIYDFCVDPDTPATPTPATVAVAASTPTPSSKSTPTNSTTTLVVSRPKLPTPPIASDDKPVNHGVLLMLLLWGAFVAHHSTSSSPPSLPRLPDHVRAASATVLDSILNDDLPHPAALTVNPASTWPKPASGLTDHIMGNTGLGGIGGGDNPPMERLHASLTQPTKAQEAEQLFSLTPTQYSALTDPSCGRASSISSSEDTTAGKSGGANRRNLAEALAAMRERRGESAAEVYTRSLLWGQIPGEVVREFKRMVGE